MKGGEDSKIISFKPGCVDAAVYRGVSTVSLSRWERDKLFPTVPHHPRIIEYLGDLEDVRTYGYKASRAAALIYAHFKKEFGG